MYTQKHTQTHIHMGHTRIHQQNNVSLWWIFKNHAVWVLSRYWIQSGIKTQCLTVISYWVSLVTGNSLIYMFINFIIKVNFLSLPTSCFFTNPLPLLSAADTQPHLSDKPCIFLLSLLSAPLVSNSTSLLLAAMLQLVCFPCLPVHWAFRLHRIQTSNQSSWVHLGFPVFRASRHSGIVLAMDSKENTSESYMWSHLRSACFLLGYYVSSLVWMAPAFWIAATDWHLWRLVVIRKVWIQKPPLSQQQVT